MLDKSQLSTVEEKDLGIGLQFTANLGKGSMTFTAGFPLDWDTPRINGLVDKLSKVIDRQSMLYELHDRKAAIANMYHQIEVQQSHKTRFDQQLREHWTIGNRRGDFKYSQDQATKLATYDTSIQGLRDAIFKAEKELQELEEKCR